MDYIDIIMPVYNCEKYISYAIESIKKQTISNWKLIIIDDASTDNTKNVIKNSIKDMEDKVELIQVEKNVGVAKARNLGLEKVRSRYIAFLDADDMWKEEKLEKQIHFMKEHQYEFTYTLFTYVKGSRTKKVRYFPPKLNYQQALKNTFILTSTVMIDTKYIEKQSIKMPSIDSEDTKTWWNILKQGKVAYGLKENLTMYRVIQNSLSSNKFKNLKKTWNLYIKYEKLGFINSIYCFLGYAFHAILKRIV